MIWKENISLDAIRERSKNTMSDHLGIEFIHIGEDSLTATLPVDERTKQPIGLLNGGASCALAETVASTAASYCVDQTSHYTVGLSLNANHLRPATSGRVTGVARAIHLGRRTQVWEVDISNQEGKTTCVVTMTMAVIERNLTP